MNEKVTVQNVLSWNRAENLVPLHTEKNVWDTEKMSGMWDHTGPGQDVPNRRTSVSTSRTAQNSYPKYFILFFYFLNCK